MQNLRNLGRYQDNRSPFFSLVFEKEIDLPLGCHIYAAGGFIEYEYLGVPNQSAGEHDLLLISAAEVDDCLLDPERTYVESVCDV